MVDTELKTAQILQNCLDAIQSGSETIETVLLRYPDLEEELRPELENAIWLMSHADMLEPDPGFVRSSRQRLMARIQSEQRENLPAPSLLDRFLAFLRMPPVVLRAAVTLLLVFILLVGTDRVVETTETAIPGDPGYTVKRSVEDLTLAVSADPGQQVVLYLEYSQRRLNEVNTLVDKSDYNQATETLDEFEVQVRSAVSSLENVRDEDTVHKELLAMTIQEKLSEHNKQLTSLLPKVPASDRPAVTRALMVSNDGVAVAQTAVRRLMTLRTPQPSEQQSPTGSAPVILPTIIQVTPTEMQIIISAPTATDEYKQIFSSTVAPSKPGGSSPGGVMPSGPVVGPNATALPTNPPDGLPTTVPTGTPRPWPTPTDTPVPATDTPVPPPTAETPMTGVITSTPVPPILPTATLSGVTVSTPVPPTQPVPSGTPGPTVNNTPSPP